MCRRKKLIEDYWKKRPESEKQQAENEIKLASCSGGFLYLDLKPIEEIKYSPYKRLTFRGKDKIAAYQQLGESLGYSLGDVSYCKKTNQLQIPVTCLGSERNVFFAMGQAIDCLEVQLSESNEPQKDLRLESRIFAAFEPSVKERLARTNQTLDYLEKRGTVIENLTLNEASTEFPYYTFKAKKKVK
ncbi:MAG TPA: hypothetical protein PLK34_00120 [Candidatus Pacearchaeota archaeon]|nr:hypothetical protein [Candidatus Pacearchaeota archaeon]